jgi:hypothetical protein
MRRIHREPWVYSRVSGCDHLACSRTNSERIHLLTELGADDFIDNIRLYELD